MPATETAEETVIEIREGEESIEVLASEIERLAEAAEKLLAGRLQKRTVILLLKDQVPGLGMRQIGAVLDALPRLRQYVKK